MKGRDSEYRQRCPDCDASTSAVARFCQMCGRRLRKPWMGRREEASDDIGPIVPETVATDRPSSVMVYFILCYRQPLWKNEIAQLTGMAYSTVHTTVERMKESGVVETRPAMVNGGQTVYLADAPTVDLSPRGSLGIE
jgi:hypothetical protein